jgi:hypothetical protein
MAEVQVVRGAEVVVFNIFTDLKLNGLVVLATMSGSNASPAQSEILFVRSLQNVAIPHRLGRHEETNATFRDVPFDIAGFLNI